MNNITKKFFITIFISDFIYSILKGLILIATLKFTYEQTNNLILIGLSLLFEVVSGTVLPLLWGGINNKRNLKYYYFLLVCVTTILSLLLLFIFLIYSFKVYILLLIYNITLSLIDPLRRITVHSSFARYLKDNKKLFFNSIHQFFVQISQVLTLIFTYYYIDSINPNYIIYSFNVLIVVLFILTFNRNLFKINIKSSIKINIKNIIVDNYNLLIKYNILIILCIFDFIYLNIFNLLLPIFSKSYSLGSTISILDLSFSIGGGIVSLIIMRFINVNNKNFKFILTKTIAIPLLLISILLSNSILIMAILSFIFGFLLLGSIIYLNAYLQKTINKSFISLILSIRRILLSVSLFIVIPLYSYISTLTTIDIKNNLYFYTVPILFLFFISIFYLSKFNTQDDI